MKFLASALALTLCAALEDLNILSRDVDGILRTQEQIQAIQDDADTNRRCHQSNGNYIPSLKAGEYSTSAFHNCFRTTDQIFEYVDALVAQNPSIMTKFSITETVRGKTIYGYKLSTSPKAESLYFESLLHAREWISGSSHLFALSSILDDIANGKSSPTDLYDLIFVPIANIDGYDISWNGNRYQRKNANEVDLNRNWPSYYKNPNPPPPSDQTYPGPRPFSEPETQGIHDWIDAHKNEIAGYIDIHSYAGLVMYPYGDTQQPIGGGEDEKFITLATNMQKLMGSNYKAQPSAALYVAYGCFDDYHYRTYKKPTLTIEIAGSDFVASASTIRTRGTEIYKALTQFAKEVVVFNGGSTTKPTTAPSTTNPTPGTTKPTPTPKTTKPTPKPTTPKPKPGCSTCSYCYYPAGDFCLEDFTKDDCDYYSADYGTIWCGN